MSSENDNISIFFLKTSFKMLDLFDKILFTKKKFISDAGNCSL